VRITDHVIRRTSYGPTSPVVGVRGARTRQAILQGALICFEKKGFHATNVEDIAAEVGVSRATLYQYFESKEQLFVDLVHTAGADLLRVIRRLGPLGPTAPGYDNLHWWLGEWAWVHDKYRGVFLQWAVVDSPEAPMRVFMAEFIESYTAAMTTRISAAVGDDIGLDTDDAAVALLAVLLRVNDYRSRGFARGLTDDELLDGFAAVVQLALFPSTPASVIVPHAAGDGRSAPQPPGPLLPAPARSARAEPRPQPDPDRFGTSQRVLETVERLLDAGAAVFGARGYHATSVGDILLEAGVARGTFYRYFDDKEALLATLAEDCAVRLASMVGRLEAVLAEDADQPNALRAWLYEYVRFHRRYRSVLRAWTEQDLADVAQTDLGFTVAVSTLRAFDRALAGIERDHPFDVRVGSITLLAMLESVPGYALGTAYDMSEERIVEVLAAFMERGLLGRRPPRPRRRPATRRR